MARLLTCVALLVATTRAYLQVSYPVYQQLPPVAHVGEQYNFQFAPTTFFTDVGPLQYSIVNGPPWLYLDDKSRTFSGFPRTSDVGIVKFNISAAGSGGASISTETELLVSGDPTPSVKEDISAPLATAGILSGPRTVTLKPSVPFQITFPYDTFVAAGKRFTYLATLADHTPLPAWVKFDGPSISFFGTTPPTDSPQTIDILLVASADPGFATSFLSFSIDISEHVLTFDPLYQDVNVTKGTDIRIYNLDKQLKLDGTPIPSDKLQSIKADLPPWLKFDNKTFEISGIAPPNIAVQNLTVRAKDNFGNEAHQDIHLLVESELFIGGIGRLHVQVAVEFEYQIPRPIFTDDDETVTIDFAELSGYIDFDPVTLKISGTVPDTFPAQTVNCLMTAKSSDNSVTDTQSFQVDVANAELNAGETTKEDGHEGHADDQPNASKRHRDGVIAGSVIGSLSGAALLFALIFLLCRRRKNGKSYINKKPPRSPNKSDISRPTFIPYGWPDIEDTPEKKFDTRKSDTDDEDPFVDRTPENPPKLDLALSRDTAETTSLGDSIGDADTRILDTFEDSSWGIHDDIAPSQHPHDSMKIATELAKRSSQKSDSFRRHKRQTTTVYQDQIHRSTGLPVNRRIVGVVNGHTSVPSRSNTHPARSGRRPLSESSLTTTGRTSTCSTVPSAFPQPPKVRKHTTMVTTQAEERRSIRIVPASIRGSFGDSRTMHERRNSYIRNRASTPSPFFSAYPHACSSTYSSPPAFISEVQPKEGSELSTPLRGVIVRPDDTIDEVQEKDFAEAKTPSKTPPHSPNSDFPGSLRKHRIARPHTAMPVKQDRVTKRYARPGSRTSLSRRASTRSSLRAYELKASLNNLTGTKVYEDDEMSDSVYSDEERDIEEAENRTTIKPGQFTLPPLDLDRVDTMRNKKRDSAAEKRRSKRDSKTKKELKRTSERDPTPYYRGFDHEHGGKENAPSSYSFGKRTSPIRIQSTPNAKVLAEAEPNKSMISRPRPKTEVQKAKRKSANWTSTHQDTTNKVRHSRKSIHSRSGSRTSAAPPKKRTHSRTQSSAYPYFDASTFDSTTSLSQNNRSSLADAVITAADAVTISDGKVSKPVLSDAASPPPSRRSGVTRERDLSGNLTFYGGPEDEPTIEELGSSSIGFRTSGGRISTTAPHQSRLAALHLSSQSITRIQVPAVSSSPGPAPTTPAPEPGVKGKDTPTVPPKSERRGTVIKAPRPPSAIGIALFPTEGPSTPAEAARRERESETRPGPRPIQMGKSGVDVEVREKGKEKDVEAQREDERVGQQSQGRGTWGTLKGYFGRGRSWASGEFWERQGRDDKVFL